MRCRALPLALGILLVSTSAASATPLHQGPLKVKEDGSVVLHGKTVAKLRLPTGERSLKVERSAKGGLLLARISAGQRESTVALSLAPGGKADKVLFSGPTGPQGVDGEWSLHLELVGERLLRYQRRPGLARCDGEAMRLFPELYDPRSGRFRAVVLPPRAGAAPVLVARPVSVKRHQRPLALSTFRAAATSTQRGDGGRAANLTAPVELVDGDPKTAWVEGRSSDGRGEWVTLRRGASPYALTGIELIPGDGSSDKAFRRRNRLASALLVLSKDVSFRIRLPRDPRARQSYRVLFPKPQLSRCVSLVVEKVYPGRGARRGGGETAIAELRVLTELDGSGGLQRLLSDLVGDDHQRARAAATILARQGAAALPDLAKALAKARGPKARRLVRVLRLQGSLPAATLATSAISRLDPSGRRLVTELLRRLGKRAIPLLTKLLSAKGDAHDEAALVAAKRLGALNDPGARQTLLTRLGKGSRRRRQAMAEALVRSGTAMRSKRLVAVLRAARDAKTSDRRADLAFVATRLARALPPAERGRTVKALIALWPGSGEQDFELRYRLIHAAGALDPRGHRAWLVARLASPSPVLRWLALRPLSQLPDPTMAPRLLAALRDGDPRVRATAAAALRRHKGPKVVGALQNTLRYEGWPVVARSAALALGHHCDAASLEALRRAISNRALGIDVAALSALARCRPPKLFDTLLTYAMSRKQPVGLRRRAAALLDERLVGDRVRILASLFLRLRREALASAAAEQVAAAFARALGRVGAQSAATKRSAGRPLVDAVSLEPSTQIRAAAARALGKLCWAPSLRALRRALKDPSPAVRRGAMAAILGCRTKAPQR